MSIANQSQWSFTVSTVGGFNVDLASSYTASVFSTALYLLGNTLLNTTQSVITKQLETRVFSPMRTQFSATKTDPWAWWIKSNINWNAVVFSNLLTASLTTLGIRDRALFISAFLNNNNYFSSFGSDGWYPEGTSYYQFAIQMTITGREIILLHTGKAIDTYANTLASLASLFPLEYPISTGNNVNKKINIFYNLLDSYCRRHVWVRV